MFGFLRCEKKERGGLGGLEIGGGYVYIYRLVGSGARWVPRGSSWEDLVNVVCLGGYEGWFFGGC